MSVILNGFFRCACGKLHTFGSLSPISQCECGRCLNCAAKPWGWHCFAPANTQFTMLHKH